MVVEEVYECMNTPSLPQVADGLFAGQAGELACLCQMFWTDPRQSAGVTHHTWWQGGEVGERNETRAGVTSATADRADGWLHIATVHIARTWLDCAGFTWCRLHRIAPSDPVLQRRRAWRLVG